MIELAGIIVAAVSLIFLAGRFYEQIRLLQKRVSELERLLLSRDRTD